MNKTKIIGGKVLDVNKSITKIFIENKPSLPNTVVLETETDKLVSGISSSFSVMTIFMTSSTSLAITVSFGNVSRKSTSILPLVNFRTSQPPKHVALSAAFSMEDI